MTHAPNPAVIGMLDAELDELERRIEHRAEDIGTQIEAVVRHITTPEGVVAHYQDVARRAKDLYVEFEAFFTVLQASATALPQIMNDAFAERVMRDMNESTDKVLMAMRKKIVAYTVTTSTLTIRREGGGWRADCDDCTVSFPATVQGRDAMARYVARGGPDADRCVKMGGSLHPCPKHTEAE